ncbi:MAG: hypothetical protein GF334_11865 [Candidatus Altiarchaeales archaeon]|nr:hypothetical protein [Candidatus Altiarchaeales archaeon]
MVPMPNPQEAVNLILDNPKEIESRFVKWAKDYHRQTGRFAEKEEAEEAVPQIMIDYVFEELGDHSLEPKMQEVVKKVIGRLLESAGMFKLDIEVVATGGEIQARMDLDQKTVN